MRRLSLLWKILLSTSIAITVLFAVTGWVIQEQFVRMANLNLEEEVQAGFQTYDSLWRARAEQLASVSMVLSRMPDVRAAFSTRDQATIRDTAGEIWEKIARERAFLLVTDPQGVVLASLGGAPKSAVQAAGSIRKFPDVAISAGQFPKQAAGFLLEGEQLYQIVMTPVYVDSARGRALLNVLVAGLSVDSRAAADLKNSTGGSDFVFVASDRVIASTLATTPADLMRGSGSTPLRVRIGSSEYTQFVTPLRDVSGNDIAKLCILRSFDAAERRIAAFRLNIFLLWAGAVLAGLALTYLLARRIVRPVLALDHAAVELSAGNYDASVRVESRDEIGRLAETFNAMGASIRSAREDLIRQERISTIGRLSTSIIHDLRNPLAAIYGGAEMLVDGDLSAEQVKRLAANIYRASRRVQELLQDLADVTRGRAHATELCRLRDVVTASREALAPAAEKQRVSIDLEVPDDIELPLDRSPMERVFENLIGNAIEAMPDGGSIRVHAMRDDGAVVVQVEDDGPGIPDAIKSRLFQPFVTEGKKNGIGLGLALSRQTLLDHGGDLWMDGTVLMGTRFVLRIPVVTVAPQ